MDKYIKVKDALELIEKYKEAVKQESTEGKLSYSSFIAITGTLEILKNEISIN